jgi:hypothetical protein
MWITVYEYHWLIGKYELTPGNIYLPTSIFWDPPNDIRQVIVIHAHHDLGNLQIEKIHICCFAHVFSIT